MDFKALINDAIDANDHQLISNIVDMLPELDINQETFINHNSTVPRIKQLISLNIKIPFEKFMHTAIVNHNLDVVDFLLSNKHIDIDSVFFDTLTVCEETWLHLAIHALYVTFQQEDVDDQKLAIVKLLIWHGADTEVDNSNGRTIMNYATGDIGYENSCDVYDFDYAQCNHIVKYFVSIGLDPNECDSCHATPLHCAGSLDPEPAFYQYMLSHGADPNIQDEFGRTPLYYLIWLQQQDHPVKLNMGELNGNVMECVMILIAFGADIYIKNNSWKNVIDCVEDEVAKVIIDEYNKVPVIPVKGVHE